VEFGACYRVGPLPFFTDIQGEFEAIAEYCCVCEVAEECLTYALETDTQQGLYGGVPKVRRMKMHREYNELHPLPELSDEEIAQRIAEEEAGVIQQQAVRRAMSRTGRPKANPR